jgi:hypothetical protein
MPAHAITPPWVILFTTLTSANRSPTQNYTRGPRLWGRLDVLTNSLKQRWRQLMVENSLETVLVDIPAVSIPNARSLKTWDICAHFRVAFYCPCTCVMIMLFNHLLEHFWLMKHGTNILHVAFKFSFSVRCWKSSSHPPLPILRKLPYTNKKDNLHGGMWPQ